MRVSPRCDERVPKLAHIPRGDGGDIHLCFRAQVPDKRLDDDTVFVMCSRALGKFLAPKPIAQPAFHRRDDQGLTRSPFQNLAD